MKKIEFPEDTMLGSLAKYVSTENKNYQPMNANFGILKPLDKKIKDKKKNIHYFLIEHKKVYRNLKKKT